jgi:hypothetical protein
VSLKAVPDLDCRGTSLNKFLVVVGLIHRELCSDIADGRVETWVNKLGVILSHHLLLNDSFILSLLRKTRAEEEKLSRYKYLQEQRVENRHARSGIQGSQRKEYHVNKDVTRPEETSEPQRDWERIPD